MTNMDLMALLSTILLIATIATTVFAVAAYLVSRGYTKKKDRPQRGQSSAGARHTHARRSADSEAL